MYEYRAIIDRVIDGDTIIVILDLGFKTFRKERIRLLGINAPELRTAEGKKAKPYVKQFEKKQCIIRTKKDRQGKYGRYLGEVIVGELNLNEELLQAGLAEIY